MGPQNAGCVPLAGAIVGLRSRRAATDGKEAAGASPKWCWGTKETSGVLREKRWTWESSLMAKRACMVPARRCFQPFYKNADAVRRPRHFDSNNSNFQRRPQRWVYQCRLAPTVQKPPPSGLLSQTGHSSYEGYGHPGNVLLPGGLCLAEFNLTRWVACTLCHTLLHSGSHRERVTAHPEVLLGRVSGNLALFWRTRE